MEHSVKGITFSEEELSTIKMEELKLDSVSPAHLFTFVRERPFLLLRAGDFIDSEFVEKYRSRGVVSFHCLEVAKKEDVQNWKYFFQQIQHCKNQVERHKLRDKFILAFGDAFWRKGEKSFLSFASACFDQFYKLPESIVQNLQATSLVLYSRSLLTSSIAVAHCFMESMVDLEFMQDIYNASFMMDYGFAEKGAFSYLLAQACEKERNRPGAGVMFLEEHPKASGERSAFFSHPTVSANCARACEKAFNHPEVIEHIRYHHEKIDGSGFPSGISYSGLAESETILMFADYMTPFGEIIFKRGDGHAIVKEAFVALSNMEDKELLPLGSGLLMWERCMDWVKNEVETENGNEDSGEAA